MLNQFETIIEPFAALSLIQLQQIMQLRQQVFMLEQQSLYLDADNNDVNATHVMVYDGAKLIAYARIVPPHLSIAHAQISGAYFPAQLSADEILLSMQFGTRMRYS